MVARTRADAGGALSEERSWEGKEDVPSTLRGRLHNDAAARSLLTVELETAQRLNEELTQERDEATQGVRGAEQDDPRFV